MQILITDLRPGEEAVIVALYGGYHFQRKLRTMGIREGKVVRVLAKHPFGGPMVVEVDGHEATIGRGMARRIVVQVEK